MIHAWCRDVARDAAVRAAEDGRTAPLLTLEECIDGMFPKSVSASSAADHENKGDGMRTERITLEIVHYGPESAAGWEWKYHIRPRHIFESVRVVEETHFDDLAQVAMERDAAIRERESWKLLADRTNERLSAAEARVAELEAASGGGEGEPVAWGISNPGHPHFGNCEVWTVRTTEEIAKAVYSDAQGWQHFPLYRAPPQPRAWLTGDERELIAGITDDDEYTEDGQNIAKALLARSTPPEVVLDAFPTDETGESFSRRDVVAALAAAGVAVKEVGRE